MKTLSKKRHLLRRNRTLRARAKLTRTAGRPRLSVLRSLKHISGQIIDSSGNVIAAVHDNNLKADTSKKGKGSDTAFACGKLLASKAKEKKISDVIFDKSHYRYHGRVKAFADGAREGGLNF